MKGTLLIALFVAGSATVSAGTECKRVHRISTRLSKPQLKVLSRHDPLFGHLIGRSKADVLECQGEPAVEKPDAWTYNERLGPGAHSFRHAWVVKFRQGKVVEVEVRREAVGCILIPSPREWLSKP
jgi:hypothetical protein